MLPFALWEGAGGRGREGRGRSGPRNVFGVREGATGFLRLQRVHLNILLETESSAGLSACCVLPKGWVRLTFTSFHPSPHPSISLFLPFNILPFLHSSSPSFYPSDFLFPSLISFTLFPCSIYSSESLPSLLLSPFPSLSPSPSLTHLHFFPSPYMVTTCVLRKLGKRLVRVL